MASDYLLRKGGAKANKSSLLTDASSFARQSKLISLLRIVSGKAREGFLEAMAHMRCRLKSVDHFLACPHTHFAPIMYIVVKPPRLELDSLVDTIFS